VDAKFGLTAAGLDQAQTASARPTVLAVIRRASSMSAIQRSYAMHNGDVAPDSYYHTAATVAPDHLGPDAVLLHHEWDLRPITLAAKRNRSGQPRRRKFVAMTPRVKKVG